MSFSLKSIEDDSRSGILLQISVSQFYAERNIENLCCRGGEFVTNFTIGDRRAQYLFGVHPSLHLTSRFGSQSDINSFMGFNPNKLQTCHRLKSEKLRCHSV